MKSLFAKCIALSLPLLLVIYSASPALAQHVTMTAGSACGCDDTTSSHSSTTTPRTATPTSRTSSGGHGGGSGGGGNAAAELSAAMHEKLAADNAARDKERDSLAATGAVNESNLNTLFNNATLASTDGTSSTVAAAELTGSNQSATSDSDFAIPPPGSNVGMSTPTPAADPTPSMPMAPMHDPGLTDVLPLGRGIDPSAPQIGAAPSNLVINGADDPNADPNVQALRLIGVPVTDSWVALADGAKALVPGEYVAEKLTGLAVDYVFDKGIEFIKDHPPANVTPVPDTPAPKK